MNDLMFNPIKGLARAKIDHLEQAEIERFRRASTIVSEPSKRRPSHFDGRLLAAPDLTREQEYFLARQADLARTSVSGVVHGLQVSRVNDTTVHIEAGNGVTPAGELVVLTEPLTVSLADVAEMQRLAEAFGLSGIPNDPPRRRSGLFVLALRPVEYTANPTAAYPASVTERRTVEDGEIIAAVAVTLIPYPTDQAQANPQHVRALVARRIFVERPAGGVPSETLPIAMLQLDRGLLLWIDPHLVRREVGAEHGGVAGFGPVPRAVREAYVLQHQRHLEEVINDRGSPRFAAAESFRSLPPAGRLPVETIERQGVLAYTQLYFPPQARVMLSLCAEDEVAAHVDESVLLPPIDLQASPDELGFTWILVLLPVPRPQLFASHLIRAVALAPATPGIVTRGLPLDRLGKIFPATLSPLRISRPATPEQAKNEAVLRDSFAAARDSGQRLWYVRRRAMRIKPEQRYKVKSINVGHR